MSPAAWVVVDKTIAVVLLANASIMRALIALASKLVDRRKDTPQ